MSQKSSPDQEPPVRGDLAAQSYSAPQGDSAAPSPPGDREPNSGPAGTASTGPSGAADTRKPPTGDRKARDAETAGGEEYAEQARASVTHVYVDSRTIGVSIEGTVTARDIAGHDLAASADDGPIAGRRRVRTLSVVAIARRDCEMLSRVAVNAGPYTRARACLDRARVVVLQGPAGVGKGTAGLSLLGLEHEVLSIDPSLTAKDLTAFSERLPYENRRYLLEALSPIAARQLTDFVLRSVSRDLHDANSYLVITVDEQTAISPEAAGYVVTWSDRPDTAAVLRNHLAYYLPDGDVGAIEQYIDMSQVCAGLASQATRAIGEAARTIAAGYAASQPVESLLEELGFGARPRAQEWFTSDRSTDELAFLLAIAVLGGAPYYSVTRHARRLEHLIAQRSRISLTTRPLDPLRPRSGRLSSAMAVLEPGYVGTEYGQSPAETVRLESRWLVQAVLDVTWQEYDLIADSLLDWLQELGDDPDPGIRLRAAAAAGWLSQYDFATVRWRLFVPWARGSSEAARTAADALGQAAWLESTAPLALAVLSAWAWQDDYDLWWTAAVAYGGEVGVRLPGVAMDQLFATALRDDDRAPAVAASCVVRLLTSGGRFANDVASYVLSHLSGWLADRPVAARTARLAYTELLSRASDPDWPTAQCYADLLLAAGSLDASAALLRATLADRDSRKTGLATLKVLVRAADQDNDSRDELTRLLKRVTDSPGTETDRERLVFYLDRWANGRDPLMAAQAIADDLREAGSHDL